MVLVVAACSDPTECILSASGMYSEWDSSMQSHRNFRKMDYESVYTHEKNAPSISVYFLHGT